MGTGVLVSYRAGNTMFYYASDNVVLWMLFLYDEKAREKMNYNKIREEYKACSNKDKVLLLEDINGKTDSKRSFIFAAKI